MNVICLAFWRRRDCQEVAVDGTNTVFDYPSITDALESAGSSSTFYCCGGEMNLQSAVDGMHSSPHDSVEGGNRDTTKNTNIRIQSAGKVSDCGIQVDLREDFSTPEITHCTVDINYVPDSC
jgi:hypothetical protein